MLKRNDIEKILPHRAPMLLIDELEREGDVAIGRYTVKGDEFFLQGHFPGNPVVPGVILCEMMAQASCLLIEEKGSFTPYFTGINKVKFRGKVLSGDTIEFKGQLTAKKGPFYFIKSSGSVSGKVCVNGELSFAVSKY
ncbi:MAG: beta-hydroxyacyl-ACP dehydratase [Oscillospiraceae bacterium]|nr:beta-hydroxyacyl-ACP dehydratase [Oscillospiraceae bacterium]